MELQLRWRQGLKKACECSFQTATENAQVEEDQEHPIFSRVNDNWTSMLLAHDVEGEESMAGLANHSFLIIFQHIGTVVWEFMQASVVEKEESGKQTNDSQAIMPTELVEAEEDATMLFRVCGAQYIA